VTGKDYLSTKISNITSAINHLEMQSYKIKLAWVLSDSDWPVILTGLLVD